MGALPTQEELRWLQTLVNHRPQIVVTRVPPIPEPVLDSLVQKNFVRAWRNGDLELTIDGLEALYRRAGT